MIQVEPYELVHVRKSGAGQYTTALVCGDPIEGRLHVNALDMDKATCSRCAAKLGCVAQKPGPLTMPISKIMGHGLRRGL